jgi:hypothetical protein
MSEKSKNFHKGWVSIFIVLSFIANKDPEASGSFFLVAFVPLLAHFGLWYYAKRKGY